MTTQLKTQQLLIYKAEGAIDGGPRLDRRAIQELVERVTQEDWWPCREPIEVRFLKRMPSKCGGLAMRNPIGVHLIAFPWNGEATRVIAHELAHVIAFERGGADAHDPVFARALLEMIYRLLGAEAWQQLSARFTALNVEVA